MAEKKSKLAEKIVKTDRQNVKNGRKKRSQLNEKERHN